MMSLQCCRHNLARLTKTFIPLQFHKPPIAFLSTTPTKKEPSPTPETPQVNPQPEEESSTSQSPPETHDKPDELSVLYDAVLAQVPQHGWTDHAISAAVTELGWSPAAKRMIARGPVQVAEQFGIRCNRRLADRLEVETKKGPAAAGGTDPVGRATFAIRDRLEMIEPYHATWRQALALQAAPRNVQKSLYNSSLLADEIAHYSGYTTPDFSWYTDRAVLGVTYHATELYWVSDKSKGRVQTWRFLENRLKDSHNLRSGLTSSFENLMTLSDVAAASVSTIIRSARRSY